MTLSERLEHIVGAELCLRRIARKHGVKPEAVLGRGRHRHTAMARHEFFLMLRDTLDMSYPEIGKLLGVDHTTVMAGVKKGQR
jgi:chromosomal replication initiation ATPase DnaA